MIESEVIARDDLVTYSRKLKQTYGDDVPVFLVGHSLGGALSILLSTTAPETVQGVSLLAPYLGFYDPQAMAKILPVAKAVNWVMPKYKFKLSDKNAVFPHNEHFFNDPLCKSLQITAHNACLNDRLFKILHESYVPKFSHPLLTIECGQDKIVSNKAMREFHEKCGSVDKTLISYENCCHNIQQDNDFWPTMVKDIATWQQTRL